MPSPVVVDGEAELSPGATCAIREVENVVWRHRPGVVADLAPAEAEAEEDEGSGRELETSWGRESLKKLADAEVRERGGAQKCEAFVV